MGGPPVWGRFSFAISRPPFHVALSRICAKVRLVAEDSGLVRIRLAVRSRDTAHEEND